METNHFSLDSHVNGGSRISQTEGVNPWIWAKNQLFGKIFERNCVKMKEIGPRGVWAARPWRPLPLPLDPSMHVTKESSRLPLRPQWMSLRVADSHVLLQALFSRGVAYPYSVFTDNRFCQVITCYMMVCVLSAITVTLTLRSLSECVELYCTRLSGDTKSFYNVQSES